MKDEDLVKSGNIEDLVTKSAGVRVSWQDKKTETDIQIAAGSTSIERTGTIITISPMPSPQNPRQIVPCAIIAGDDKKWYMVMPFDVCKIL